MSYEIKYYASADQLLEGAIDACLSLKRCEVTIDEIDVKVYFEPPEVILVVPNIIKARSKEWLQLMKLIQKRHLECSVNMCDMKVTFASTTLSFYSYPWEISRIDIGWAGLLTEATPEWLEAVYQSSLYCDNAELALLDSSARANYPMTAA